MIAAVALLLASADAPAGLRAAIREREAAYRAHDVARLAALQAADSRIVSPNGDQSGVDAIRSFLQRLFTRRPDLSMTRSADRLTDADGGSETIEEGGWRERWTEAGAPVELRGRYLIVWTRTDTGWRQRLEAFSATHCTGPTYCNR